MKFVFAFVILLVIPLLASAVKRQQAPTLANLLADFPNEDIDASDLQRALEISEVNADLAAREEDFTIFVPTNQAFRTFVNATSASTLTSRLEALEEGDLRDILLYHVVPETVSTADMTNEQLLDTLLEDSSIRINIYRGGDVITANGATIVERDVEFDNGLAQVVNKVLVPPEFSIFEFLQQSELADPTIVLAIMFAGFADTLNQTTGSWTALVPSEEALKALDVATLEALVDNPALVTDIVENHLFETTLYTAAFDTEEQSFTNVFGSSLTFVMEGQNVTVENATFLESDFTAFNGVVHFIDQVLLPESVLQAIAGTGNVTGQSCSATFECEAVSEDFNFVTCTDGLCQCRDSFLGNATENSLCRCEAPNRIIWNNTIPICADLTTCLSAFHCSEVSENFNFVECVDTTCTCKEGFQGSATQEDRCRCEQGAVFSDGETTCPSS